MLCGRKIYQKPCLKTRRNHRKMIKCKYTIKQFLRFASSSRQLENIVICFRTAKSDFIRAKYAGLNFVKRTEDVLSPSELSKVSRVRQLKENDLTY